MFSQNWLMYHLRDLLGYGIVKVFTFLLRPALPCPALSLFQVEAFTSVTTVIHFIICFSGFTLGLIPYLLHVLMAK